jgi:hypothetical protein
MRLKKAPVWICGLGAAAGVLAYGFAVHDNEVIFKGLDAVILLVGIGLGANLGEATQKSIWYKPDMDKEQK